MTAIMKDESCLCMGCAGRLPIRADSGICRCGLYWEIEMPLHARDGHVVPTEIAERWYRRTREAYEVEERRKAVRRDITRGFSWRK